MVQVEDDESWVTDTDEAEVEDALAAAEDAPELPQVRPEWWTMLAECL